MPQIEGLKEQQEALIRVTKNLKKVEEVNDFLKNVLALSQDDTFEASHNVSITFTNGNEMKKYKCPLLFKDMGPILDGAQRYKDTIAAEVRKDATDYRISLTQKEMESLDWNLRNNQQ